MLRSLSRAQGALASSPPVRKPARPPAKRSARAERGRLRRRATHQTHRHGVARRTDTRIRRR